MGKLTNSKRFRWLAILLVVVLVVGGGLFVAHVHSVHQAQKASGSIPTSKKTKTVVSSGTKSQQTATSQTSVPPSTDSTKLQGSTSGNSAALETPFGNFVSNHRPGQSGSPDTEQSVCNTTPGATCDIQFTNSAGTTKSLGAEVVDSNGSAYWSWTVNGATLAPGSWQIMAVVKLNGQTKTATDPTPLEVQ